MSLDAGVMGDLQTLVLPPAADIHYVRAADSGSVFAGLIFFNDLDEAIGDCTSTELAACGMDMTAANPDCIPRCYNDAVNQNKILGLQVGPTVDDTNYPVWHPAQTWPDPVLDQKVLIGFASHSMFTPEFTTLSFVFVTRV